nr:glutamine-dependent NAD(+) synthetase [Tanacetum cinerariifolium]
MILDMHLLVCKLAKGFFNNKFYGHSLFNLDKMLSEYNMRKLNGSLVQKILHLAKVPPFAYKGYDQEDEFDEWTSDSLVKDYDDISSISGFEDEQDKDLGTHNDLNMFFLPIFISRTLWEVSLLQEIKTALPTAELEPIRSDYSQRYSPEDNIFDLCQFLYYSGWPYHFHKIDELVNELSVDNGASTSNGVGSVAAGLANPKARL